jgi:EAL domain-containing protein (putative c-di-GMP-specific phosphodiesterase class I)/CheY-like chemotaxis protein
MPKRSGWEVCQALKAVQRTQGIRVVLITGKGDVKDRLTGLQLGADDYLVKPIHRGEVLKRVGDLLADSRPVIERSTEPVTAGQTPLSVMINDPATGLPTIPSVLDRLKEWMIEKSELGVIFIDIEQFEAIEAEYGWAFFDEFLRRVGESIRAEAKKRFTNPIVAVNRVAGSSFYIFVPTSGTGLNAEALAQHDHEIRESLRVTLQERFPKMQAEQIGFFSGSSRVCYEPQIRLERQIYAGMQTAVDTVRNAEQQRKRQLVRELREIIRRRQVTTFFQPIVRASDGGLFGYEILTRGPAKSSFRNSDMLFSFARETKLAWDLEAMALQNCMERLRDMDLGDRKFLLNLEAEMFEIDELRLHEVVDFAAANQGRFVFELTERAAIEDYGAFRELLAEFRAKGIEIAIDDAGSGYASLEAIASLAPDYLKITKGLISTISREPIKQDLIRMLVELAHRINARTIAEGIETEEEWVTCRDLGIDLMQGYYIARPQQEIQSEQRPGWSAPAEARP